MARLRVADPVADSGVPEELLSPGHPVWHDPAEFARWCAEHKVMINTGMTATWAERFQHARDAWAVAVGICPPGRRPTPARLAELGIPHSGALDRARAEAGSPLTPAN